jgi:hypothetical protein
LRALAQQRPAFSRFSNDDERRSPSPAQAPGDVVRSSASRRLNADTVLCSNDTPDSASTNSLASLPISPATGRNRPPDAAPAQGSFPRRERHGDGSSKPASLRCEETLLLRRDPIGPLRSEQPLPGRRRISMPLTPSHEQPTPRSDQRHPRHPSCAVGRARRDTPGASVPQPPCAESMISAICHISVHHRSGQRLLRDHGSLAETPRTRQRQVDARAQQLLGVAASPPCGTEGDSPRRLSTGRV